MPFDPASDFADVTDGFETVTLRDRDGRSSQTLTTALRRAVSRQEAESSDGKYVTADTVWHLAAEELTATPSVADVLVDGQSEHWTILEVQRQTLLSRVRCVCRSLAILGGLNELITIQKAEFQADRTGAPAQQWRDIYTGVRAKIQPVAADEPRLGRNRPVGAAPADRSALSITHRVFVARPLRVDHRFRIVHNECVYRIVGYENPQRIDQLFTLDVVEQPWPQD